MFLLVVVRDLALLGKRVELLDCFFRINAQLLYVGTDESLHEHTRWKKVISILFEKLEIGQGNLGTVRYLLEGLAPFLSKAFKVFSKRFH
jgi:hypothetical protein